MKRPEIISQLNDQENAIIVVVVHFIFNQNNTQKKAVTSKLYTLWHVNYQSKNTHIWNIWKLYLKDFYIWKLYKNEVKT